jgi:hypothetical protein
MDGSNHRKEKIMITTHHHEGLSLTDQGKILIGSLSSLSGVAVIGAVGETGAASGLGAIVVALAVAEAAALVLAGFFVGSSALTLGVALAWVAVFALIRAAILAAVGAGAGAVGAALALTVGLAGAAILAKFGFLSRPCTLAGVFGLFGGMALAVSYAFGGTGLATLLTLVGFGAIGGGLALTGGDLAGVGTACIVLQRLVRQPTKPAAAIGQPKGKGN